MIDSTEPKKPPQDNKAVKFLASEPRTTKSLSPELYSTEDANIPQVLCSKKKILLDNLAFTHCQWDKHWISISLGKGGKTWGVECSQPTNLSHATSNRQKTTTFKPSISTSLNYCIAHNHWGTASVMSEMCRKSRKKYNFIKNWMQATQRVKVRYNSF